MPWIGPISVDVVEDRGFQDVLVGFAHESILKVRLSPVEADRLGEALCDAALMAENDGDIPTVEVSFADISKAISDACPDGWRFVLCLREKSTGETSYHSNSPRAEAAALLTLTTKFLEGAREGRASSG